MATEQISPLPGETLSGSWREGGCPVHLIWCWGGNGVKAPWVTEPLGPGWRQGYCGKQERTRQPAVGSNAGPPTLAEWLWQVISHFCPRAFFLMGLLTYSSWYCLIKWNKVCKMQSPTRVYSKLYFIFGNNDLSLSFTAFDRNYPFKFLPVTLLLSLTVTCTTCKWASIFCQNTVFILWSCHTQHTPTPVHPQPEPNFLSGTQE